MYKQRSHDIVSCLDRHQDGHPYLASTTPATIYLSSTFLLDIHLPIQPQSHWLSGCEQIVSAPICGLFEDFTD